MINIISRFITFSIIIFLEYYLYYEISDIMIYDNSYKKTICYSQYNYWLSYDFPDCIFEDTKTFPLYQPQICYIKDCTIIFNKPLIKSYIHQMLEMKIYIMLYWILLELLKY